MIKIKNAKCKMQTWLSKENSSFRVRKVEREDFLSGLVRLFRLPTKQRTVLKQRKGLFSNSPQFLFIPPAFANQELGNITGFEKGFFPDLTKGIAEEGGAGWILERVFSNLLGVFTLVGGMMLIIYFVLGALGWVSAGGDAERLQKAQNQMTNAIIGLILVVAAYGVFYIVGLVVGFNILKPAEELLKLKP